MQKILSTGSINYDNITPNYRIALFNGRPTSSSIRIVYYQSNYRSQYD
ncbi:hypothetical protein HYD49_02890 [Mycoplasmopsis bovis]|nr:hypothetical protein [Mycoplasmopsis bovis]QQH72824.1 hypothetical protein HYD49_02890 [Mycoplasmopsis bovis]